MVSRRWLEQLILCLTVCFVYSNTLHSPFILDDHNAIVNNHHIRTILPISRALSAPPQSTVAGRPVAAFSLALNYAVSGMDPWSYHCVNILIHLLSTLLLLGILRRLLPENCRYMAGLTAMVWSLHPLHTEVVTYVSTRTESIAGMFFLLAFYAMIRSAERKGSQVWQILGIAAVALAMGSKESAVVIPPVLLLADRVFLSESWKSVMRRRGRFHQTAALMWIIPAILIMGNPRGDTVSIHFSDLTPLDYLRTQAGVIIHYLKLAFIPHPLVLDYADWPIAHAFTLKNIVLLALLAGLAVISIVKAVSGSKTAFLGVWFFAALAPSSSIVPIASEIAAERRMYLPLIAVILLTGVLIYQLNRWLNESTVQRTAVVLSAAICLIFCGLTFHRNTAYASSVSIWEDTVQKRPRNPRAHANLGTAYLETGRKSEAFRHFQTALQLDNRAFRDGTLRNASLKSIENLGLMYLDSGHAEDAVRLLEMCLKYQPDDPLTHLNLAKACLATDNLTDATHHVARAVDLAPGDPTARIRYAQLLALAGDYDSAKRQARQAARLAPGNPSIQNTAKKILALENPASSR